MWRPLRLLVTLILAGGLASSASMQTRSRPEADLEKWLSAVRAHRPGTLDLHARAIAVWPWDTLEPVLDRAKALKDPGILLRAAVLYLDIAVHTPRGERPVYPTRGTVLRMKDGRPVGTDTLDPHIWWARHLVDAVLKAKNATPEHVETATRWYQVTSAVLAGRQELADQHWHLQSARLLFPEDPVLLLDAGCLAETLGSPMIQAATAQYEEASTPASAGPRRSRFPEPDEYRREAERLFQESIAAGNTGEAHLRLGWVLVQRGRMNEALPHLESARADPDDVVRYFAWLFIGHARARHAKWDPAVQAYRAALGLFPDAQAAHLGLSHIAAERGAFAEARTWLSTAQGKSSLARAESDDPWWTYTWCRGRDYGRIHTRFANDFAGHMR